MKRVSHFTVLIIVALCIGVALADEAGKVVVCFRDGEKLFAISAKLTDKGYEVVLTEGAIGVFPVDSIQEIRPPTEAEERLMLEQAKVRSIQAEAAAQARDRAQAKARERALAEGFGSLQYRGSERPAEWVGEQYNRFKDVIVEVEGRYYSAPAATFLMSKYAGEQRDSGWASKGGLSGTYGYHTAKWIAGRPQLINLTEGARQGTVGIFPYAKLFQVLGGDCLLVECKWSQSQEYRYFAGGRIGPSYTGERIGFKTISHQRFYYISGLSTETFVDGQSLARQPFILVGTHRYATAIGSTKTVESLRPVRTLTPKDFVEALEQGVVLEEWIPGKGACRDCKGTGKEEAPPKVRHIWKTRKCGRCDGTGEAVLYERVVVE